MRVIHVMSEFAQQASGTSYSVPRLCQSLSGIGVDVQLATLDWAPSVARPGFLKTFPRGAGPRRLGLSPALARWLNEEAAADRVDVMHNHGLWRMPTIYPGEACKRGKKVLVISPEGMLAARALAYSAVSKRLFWRFCQARALQAAACFHATAENEYEDIRKLGFKQPICVIPHGVDLPPITEKPRTERRVLLFLGRIHPIKGVDGLLKAWQAVESRFPEWDLHIAGPSHANHGEEMQMLAKTLRLERVKFLGPLYGQDKAAAYRRATVFVLPTHSENFGLTVAESLAAGTPAIVSKGAPWSDLEKHGAGWWIDVGVDPLIACLEQALSLSRTRLAEMGIAGRAWMEKDFSWDQIGKRLLISYRWILQGGETPPWIRMN